MVRGGAPARNHIFHTGTMNRADASQERLARVLEP